MNDRSKFPAEIEEDAKKWAFEISQLGVVTISDEWIDGNSAFVRVRITDRRELLMQYDFNTKTRINCNYY